MRRPVARRWIVWRWLDQKAAESRTVSRPPAMLKAWPQASGRRPRRMRSWGSWRRIWRLSSGCRSSFRSSSRQAALRSSSSMGFRSGGSGHRAEARLEAPDLGGGVGGRDAQHLGDLRVAVAVQVEEDEGLVQGVQAFDEAFE